jgi:predicted peptidase
MPEILDRQHHGRNYLVVKPDAYVPGETPAILFLHGSGESGSELATSKNHSLLKAVQKDPARWPFLIVVPQKLDSWILWPHYRAHVDGILEAVEKEFPTDPKRRYLTGLSQGGNGSFVLAKGLRWRFAAVAPVCGWGDPMLARETLSDVPLWIFHGDADPVVPCECSRAIVAALGTKHPSLKYSEYAGVDHNSWDRAYAEEELPKWLLRHSF